jgi:hypothetical protein
MPVFKYSAEQIGRAISKERMGGTCAFYIIADGEPFFHNEIIDIIYRILEQGHYLFIATNGTLTKQFKKFGEFPQDYLKRLLFRFSFHYLELIRTDNLGVFFNNAKFVKSIGCSYYMTLCLDDSYIPYFDEIKSKCMEELGQAPIISYKREIVGENKYEIGTKLPLSEYQKWGRYYGTNLVDYELKYFMVRPKGFCYAGDWVNIVDLLSGIMKPCWDKSGAINLFENPEEPAPFEAIGNNCTQPYCMCGSNFYSVGVMPGIEYPNFTELRDRGGFTEEMRHFFGSKLAESNKKYNPIKKLWINFKNSSMGKKFMQRIFTPPPPHDRLENSPCVSRLPVPFSERRRAA